MARRIRTMPIRNEITGRLRITARTWPGCNGSSEPSIQGTCSRSRSRSPADVRECPHAETGCGEYCASKIRNWANPVRIRDLTVPSGRFKRAATCWYVHSSKYAIRIGC